MTPSQAKYLLKIKKITDDKGFATFSDIALATGYSGASVSRMVAVLSQEKLIIRENDLISLSKKGENAASSLLKCIESLSNLFMANYGLPINFALMEATNAAVSMTFSTVEKIAKK